jgi:hypothetical protein
VPDRGPALRHPNLIRATFAVALAAASPAFVGKGSANPQPGKPLPRSYLELPLGPSGELASHPYVWERRFDGKHVAILGTRHLRDPSSSMFERIQTAYDRVRPQIVIHESQAPPQLAALSREQAIRIGADLGFAIHLASAGGATIRSGDPSVRSEIRALMARFSTEEVLVFLTSQRHIGYTKEPNLADLGDGYVDFYDDYLVANGFPRHDSWDSWNGFREAYRRVAGRSLSAKTWDRDLTSPIHDNGRLSEISRVDNAFRDGYLVGTIRKALAEYDRVLVVFGSWHVLSLEPVLEAELSP